MKRFLGWVGVLGMLLLAACGPEAVVERPAMEMNLALADLPEGFRQKGQDLGLADILQQINLSESDKGAVKDGSMRIFTATLELSATAGIRSTEVVAVVLRFDSEGAAQSGANDIATGFGDAMRTIRVTPEVLGTTPLPAPASWGVFSRVQLAEQGAQVYLAVFHKKNVLGLVLVSGPQGEVEGLAVRLAQTMEKKFPLPATP